MSRTPPFVLALAAVACAPELPVRPADPDALAFAVGGPRLSHDPLPVGGSATLTVDGADPFESVSFAAALREGAGPCPASLGGLCLDLASPRLLGRVTADATGTARLVFAVPGAFVAGDALAFQAAIARGPGGIDSVVTSVAIATITSPGGVDDDGDGYDSVVDCDDGDASVHPGATERCDGVDTDCDPATGEDGLVTANGTVNYPSIADAVLFTPPGGVIDACPGVYDALMLVNVPLTINGIGGPGEVVLDASGIPGYPIQLVSSASGTVFRNLTLDGADGDCAMWISTDVTLDQMIVTDSDVNGSPVCTTSYGHLTMLDSVVSNNVGVDSGGVFLDGDAVIERTTFVANTSTSGLGGALVSDASSAVVQLTDSVVIANTSVGGGAAVWSGHANYTAGTDLQVVNTDFGAGVNENLPADVHLEGSGRDYRTYQAGSTFTCGVSTCY